MQERRSGLYGRHGGQEVRPWLVRELLQPVAQAWGLLAPLPQPSPVPQEVLHGSQQGAMMRWLIERPCWLLHRMWGIPVWNRSLFLNCPIAWACYRFPKFERWYWDD